MTRGIMLESENSEFQVISFCPIPKNDNSDSFLNFVYGIMLGSGNSESQVIFFCLY